MLSEHAIQRFLRRKLKSIFTITSRGMNCISYFKLTDLNPKDKEAGKMFIKDELNAEVNFEVNGSENYKTMK